MDIEYINTVITKINDIYHNQKKTIALANTFLHSLFIDIFGDPILNQKGWKVEKLSNIQLYDIYDKPIVLKCYIEHFLGHLSMRNISSEIIPIPDISAQLKFEKIVNKVTQLKLKQKEKFKQCILLTKSDINIFQEDF